LQTAVLPNQLTVLLKEYERVYLEIIALQRKGELLTAGSLTFLTAGFAAAFRDSPLIEVIFLAPLLYWGVLLYFVQVTTVQMLLGGYKRYLEQEINRTIDDSVLQWERMVVPKVLHKHPSMVFAWIVPFGLTVVVSVASCWYAYDNDCHGWLSLTAFGCWVLFVIFVATAQQMQRSFEAAYKFSVECRSQSEREFSPDQFLAPTGRSHEYAQIFCWF